MNYFSKSCCTAILLGTASLATPAAAQAPFEKALDKGMFVLVGLRANCPQGTTHKAKVMIVITRESINAETIDPSEYNGESDIPAPSGWVNTQMYICGR